MKFVSLALLVGLAAAAVPAPSVATPKGGRSHARAAASPRRAATRSSPVRTSPKTPAAVQNVRPQDPGSLVRALQAGGYKAALGTDKAGDPMITSAVSGTTFQIFFYNCTVHKECATIQLHSGYDFDHALPLETINAWNSSQRFGRAYLDKENDPILEMDVDLDDGGVSPLLFIDNIEFWSSVLSNFEKHIGYRT
jgi:hypothetical protein